MRARVSGFSVSLRCYYHPIVLCVFLILLGAQAGCGSGRPAIARQGLPPTQTSTCACDEENEDIISENLLFYDENGNVALRSNSPVRSITPQVSLVNYTYSGDPAWSLPSLNLKALDFSKIYAIEVTGSFPNPCGHMLLNIGGPGGWYFHVSKRKALPDVMGEVGYRRYLTDNKKTEKNRYEIPLSNPAGAQLELEQQLKEKWRWFVLPHNCVSFVETIAHAGGSNSGLYSNCPKLEKFR